MKVNRTRNAVWGTLTGLCLKLLQILFPFVIRTIFIHTLGIEYLGLNSLFTSLLQVINLAELGISSALVFCMYKPIVEDDQDKICALLNLYRKYYSIIGFVVLGIGLAFLPFIPKMISGTIPPDINIYAIYLINLTSTVLSYWLFAYRNSLFVAHQRNDIVNTISFIANILVYCFQIVVLCVFKNYYTYLLTIIVHQILLNLFVAGFSKKQYPQYKPRGSISIAEKKNINAKVRDLFTAKIGAVVNNSVDSIIISAFLGLQLLAIYQNYFYIISAIMSMFSIFCSACSAGIGNRLLISSDSDNKDLFYNINFIVFFATNFCCASLISLYQPFMELWVGKELMLDFPIVILFAIYLFVEEVPKTMVTFKDAGGIWREDRFRPLMSALFNLVVNISLVSFIGLYGILLSTILSLVLISVPWLIVNINKHLLHIDIAKFVRRISSYAFVTFLSSALSYIICSRFNINNLIGVLFARSAVCLVVPNLIFLIFFWMLPERKYLFSKIHQFLKKQFGKGI